MFKKIISNEELTAMDEDLIYTLTKINHPNINHVIKFSLLCKTGKFCCYSNFCNLKSINEYIQKYKISFQFLNQLLQQTLAGLSYLHHKNLIHSDLKLSNILINKKSKEYCFKISDILTLKKEGSLFQSNGGYYTPEIISPEVYNLKIMTSKMDVWSLGVLTYLLFTKTYPFGDRRSLKIHEIKNNVVSNIVTGPEIEFIQNPYKEFIKHCLVQDPMVRPSAKELLDMFT